MTMLLIVCPVFLAAGTVSGGAVVYDFEKGLRPWRAGPGGPVPTTVSGLSLARLSRVASLKLKRHVSACLRTQTPMDLTRFRTLRFLVRLPKAHAKMHLAVHLVDRDDHWFQTAERIIVPRGRWTAIEVDLRPEAAVFESLGHARPWGPYVARHVREIGLHLFADRPVSGEFCVDDIEFVPAADGRCAQEIFNFEVSGDEVGRYERIEITFELARTYANPFDPAEIQVRGRFTAPSGKAVEVPGFFSQDFERRIDRKIERLTPVGSPKWKVRFAPRELGEYTYVIEVSDGETLRTSPRRFRCVSSESRGFVRVCTNDPRYFEFDDGTFFYPIGHNIPATFNVKGAAALGLTVEPFEGTFAFDRYLDGMARGKENFARVWMASWSFGIEWSPRYQRSYRGLGRYNLENAWRLDYVLDKAERNGIYVQLALTTFGHFRLEKFEGDWAYSPYNVRNHGPLQRPQQFWTHAESQETYQRMVRYAMARWGYSSHVAAWELINEIDLVTGYGKLKPQIIEWHRRCVRTIREFDPNPHLITTNFAIFQNDPAILSLPEISYSSTNHYNVQIIRQMRKVIFPIKTKFGKPAIMAECGYDFKGALAETTERYLHICLWSSYMIPFAGAGLSWWWDFLDDRDLYHRFAPLAEFAEGEDRRGRGLEMSEGALREQAGKPVPQLAADTLQNDRSAYFWIYERRLLRAEADADFTPGPRENIVLELRGLLAGEYRIEFWDTRKGGCIQQLTAPAKDGILRCPVPRFTSDVAGKVKPMSNRK